MSDIEVVPVDGGWMPEGVVPYGTVFSGVDMEADGQHQSFESLHGVPSVDWGHVSVDNAVTVPAPRRGRPPKVVEV